VLDERTPESAQRTQNQSVTIRRATRGGQKRTVGTALVGSNSAVKLSFTANA
jgi:hypothetical protein